ncbi:hypothetical protein LSH36_310g03052 [Paralvinella palmiformis]|uniref:COMM domain-containing protein n=1 Tax=Paralvinella palmiformis TaxID=53620 RepID=A0AAD9N0W2_9ANNE|nr:hypothetical protein LSH36_310g03052 [Paralvinella palmiformis]
MRFRFCGDLDCPDWVLAEIATLSRLTSVKMKLLCLQVLKHLLGQDIDYEKAHKLTSDAKFALSDIKATIAVLSYILSSAAKYNVDSDTLLNELQQLGLPKEHATSLCKSYGDNLTKLQAELHKKSMRVSSLESVDWRVDYLVSSSQLKEVKEPCVQLRLKVKNPDTDTVESSAFIVDSDKFRVLVSVFVSVTAAYMLPYKVFICWQQLWHPDDKSVLLSELKQAYSKMDNLGS